MFELRNISHLTIVIWLSIAAFLHNVLMNGSMNVIISSIQKEFYLSSRETGMYISIYDVGSLISSVFVPVVGTRGSKPRWISFGLIMLFLGCMINALPHFLRPMKEMNDEHKNMLMFNTTDTETNPGVYAEESAIELCNYSIMFDNSHSIHHRFHQHQQTISHNVSSSYTTKKYEPLTKTFQNDFNKSNTVIEKGLHFYSLKYILYTASIVSGLSSASVTTVAISYIEDISSEKLSSVYESVYFAVGALGIGAGFMITSQFLKIHSDIDRYDSIPNWLTPAHPNFVGAWWLPFLIFGNVALLLALLIFFFPNRKIDHANNDRSNEAQQEELIELKNQKHNDSRQQEQPESTNPSIYDQDITAANSAVVSEAHSENEEGEEGDIDKQKHRHDRHHLHVKNSLLISLQHTGSLISLNKLSAIKSHVKHKQEQPQRRKKQKLASMYKNSILLLKNPIYICIVISSAIEGLLQNSFLAFASLFIQYQYRSSSGTTSLIIGILSIPPLILGGIISGLIVNKFNNNMNKCLKFLNYVVFLNILVYIGFMLYCQEPNVLLDEGLAQNSYNFSNTEDCVSTAISCNCNTKIFKPVCLSGSENSFVVESPCLAGCLNYDSITGLYSNCSLAKCYNSLTTTSNYSEDSSLLTFVNGFCPSNSCMNKLIITYCCIFFLMLLNALSFIPYLKATIGCVQSSEMNTIALGIRQFAMTAFGQIPGPILFGSIIDTTCKYWHTDLYNQSTCKIYNNKEFAFWFGLLAIIFKIVCFLLISASVICAKRNVKRNQKTGENDH